MTLQNTGRGRTLIIYKNKGEREREKGRKEGRKEEREKEKEKKADTEKMGFS